MATPNVFNKVLRVRPTIGFRFRQLDVPIAASQTIYTYDILAKTSGANTFEQSIALPGTNSTGTASGGSLPIYAVALAPITTGSGGTETTTGRSTIPVAVFDDNLELEMRIYNATAANAEPRDISLTGATKYQFQRWRGTSATEWWYSLIVTTTNGEFTYVERGGDSADDDDYGLVWVKAIASVRQGG